ncbi:MAG: hypothetical protein R3C61_17205 [Bacteroidia bacterium]
MKPVRAIRPVGFTAAVNFQRRIGKYIQSVRLIECQVADKAVMAGGAFEVKPQQGLGNILRSLHLRSLGGVDRAAPAYSFDKPQIPALG